MAKALTAKQQQALAAAEMYESDADDGFETADADSYAIPMLNILQSLSPQVDESDGAYIEGAKPGMIFNNVTNQLYNNDDGLTVIPCAYKRSFVEWKPDRGGFVADHDLATGSALMDEAERDDRNQNVLPNGNILADTRTHYVLCVYADGSYEPAVVAMASTQLKKSRKWMYRMKNMKMQAAEGRSFTPPMYAHKWRLTTVKEENDKGKWFGWKEDLLGGAMDTSLVVEPELFNAAKEFKTLVASGTVQVKMTEEADDEPGF